MARALGTSKIHSSLGLSVADVLEFLEGADPGDMLSVASMTEGRHAEIGQVVLWHDSDDDLVGISMVPLRNRGETDARSEG